MARPLLWILILFLIFQFLGPCRSKPAAPPPVATVDAAATLDPAVLAGPGGREARFTGDGALAELREGDRLLVRAEVPFRRPFSTLLREKSGKRPLLEPRLWTYAAEEGAALFRWADGDVEVTKRFSFDPDGALRAVVEAKKLPDSVEGLEMTALSGVLLRATDESPTGLFVGRGAALDFRSHEALAQRQEQILLQIERMRERDELKGSAPPIHESWPLAEGAAHRAGILGHEAFLRIEGLPGGATAHAEALQVRKGDEPPRREIEAWTSLPASAGAVRCELILRAGAAADLRTLEPDLYRRSEFASGSAAEHRLENGTLRIDLSERGAAIVGARFKDFTQEAGQSREEAHWVHAVHAAVGVGRRPLTLSVQNTDRYGADPARDVWRAEEASPARVRFVLETPKGWKFVKTVALPEEGRYDLAVTLEITPPKDLAEPDANFALTGPAAFHIEDVHRGITAGSVEAGLVLERKGGDDEVVELEKLKSAPLARDYPNLADRGLLRAVGSRGAFFVCLLATPEEKDAQGFPAGVVSQATVRAITMDREVRRPDGTSSAQSILGQLVCSLDFRKGAVTRPFVLYMGPNEIERLRPLGLEDAVDFGTFGFIGRPLMWLMKRFEGLVGSYGIAVILMTLAVRLLLTPVSYRTQLSMARYAKRIQKIKPILDELEKKHAGNREKLARERFLVMRENKVGVPFGCLTIFIQIPIWYGLFQALRVEFSLRHQPFLWAKDLSMPDRLFGLPVWPHWFNLLPLLMLVLWILQQRMTPTPASDDPQVRAQMKMVRFMPYVFFFFLYNYAAALSVYMCVSSIWGIFEGKFVKKAIARVT